LFSLFFLYAFVIKYQAAPLFSVPPPRFLEDGFEVKEAFELPQQTTSPSPPSQHRFTPFPLFFQLVELRRCFFTSDVLLIGLKALFAPLGMA